MKFLACSNPECSATERCDSETIRWTCAPCVLSGKRPRQAETGELFEAQPLPEAAE